jgi:hypothetical protein
LERENTMMQTIKSPGVKIGPLLGLHGFAMVMWICNKCDNTIFVHEVIGENHEPRCPQCDGHMEFNKVYHSDHLGNIIE